MTDRSQLDYGVVANRTRLFINNGKRLPVSEFFTFVPLLCFTCLRERTAEQITMGPDWVFHCLDREDCMKYWHGKKPPPEQPKLSTRKHKYRVKKK